MRKAAIAAIGKRADHRAADLMPMIAELQAAGATSLRSIAAGFNERGIPTARGGKWSAVQAVRSRSAIAAGPHLCLVRYRWRRSAQSAPAPLGANTQHTALTSPGDHHETRLCALG